MAPCLRIVLVSVAVAAVAVLACGTTVAALETAAAVRYDTSPLMFRSHQLLLQLDSNGDHRLSHDEIDPHIVKAFFPTALGTDEFKAFLNEADRNGDGLVDQDELDDALAEGMALSPEFLELGQGRGFFDTIGGAIKTGFNKVLEFTGLKKSDEQKAAEEAAKQVGGADDEKCVFCQYVVERMETNVKTSGVIPTPENQDSWNTGGRPSTATSFLEVDSQQFNEPGMTNARRAAVHDQRVAERAKYNQIYRIVDITLDDVCEQAMPDMYYKYCKQVYSLQADMVDGLRYQYRPADICYKTAMCAPTSYITSGIHNRRRFAAIQQAEEQQQEEAVCTDPMKC